MRNGFNTSIFIIIFLGILAVLLIRFFMKNDITKYSFRADIATIFVGMLGCFGYYQKAGESLWLWIIVLSIGILSMLIGDVYHYLQTKSASVFWDIPVLIVLLILLKYIDLHHGVSFLTSLVLCLGYGFYTKKYRMQSLTHGRNENEKI